MTRWKARVEFLLSIIELLFLSLTVEALQGKTFQDSLRSGGGRSVQAKISGGRGVPGEYFLVSTKLDTFCTMLRAVVLTQYRRATDGRTDRQTDGIAVASTALAMRALRQAVKTACANNEADFIAPFMKHLATKMQSENFYARIVATRDHFQAK